MNKALQCLHLAFLDNGSIDLVLIESMVTEKEAFRARGKENDGTPGQKISAVGPRMGPVKIPYLAINKAQVGPTEAGGNNNTIGPHFPANYGNAIIPFVRVLRALRQ
jgi:hypothetical protein